MNKREWSLFGLYFGFLAVLLVLTIALKADFLSFFYIALTVSGIYLNSIQKRIGLLFFALGAALYVYINFVNVFYGEFALYIIFTLYYLFFFVKKPTGIVEIKSIKPLNWLYFLGGLAIFCPVYAVILTKIGTNQAILNSILSGLSFVAVVLTASRFYQQYAMWILINALQICLWFSTFKGQDLSYINIILINFFLVIMNSYNLFSWRRLYKNCERS